MINYIVIWKGEYGYPPDPEILEYMQCNSFVVDENVFLSLEYKNRVPNSADQKRRKLNIGMVPRISCGHLTSQF
jgi:hypothetical protein